MTDGAAENETAQKPRRISWLGLLPFGIFAVLAGIFAWQLLFGAPPNQLPSALIGRPAPALTLAPLEGLNGPQGQMPGFEENTLDGKVSIVNVWASWCVPCRTEHPYLVQLAQDERLQITGLNYKDAAENALRFLGQLGNPFTVVGVDPRGKGAIEWGVYGVPETFIVDANGMIAHKHVGPLTDQNMRDSFLPALERAIADGSSAKPAGETQ